MKRLVFIAGLPRSGSTLLCNLLSQNPDICVGGTSPLSSYVAAVRRAALASSELKADLSGQHQIAYTTALYGLIEGHMTSSRPISVDKSRAWLHLWPMLKRVFPKRNVYCIVCIRDLRGICASLERRRRRFATSLDPVEVPDSGDTPFTVEERCMSWLTGGLVGTPLKFVADAYQSGYLDDVCLIPMEGLTLSPHATLDRLYSHLGMDSFLHDADAVPQLQMEHDPVYGMDGLHQVFDKVVPLKEDWNAVLTRPVADRIRERYAWFYELFYPSR